MRFNQIATFMLLAAVATASAIPQAAGTEPASTTTSFTGTKGSDGVLVAGEAPTDETSQSLQKRQLSPTAVVLATYAIEGIAAITAAAITTGIQSLVGLIALAAWNSSRERFTKATTAEMWRKNPDYNKFSAAICYNKGYRVQNADNVAGKAKVKYSLGALSTDYDCMYMAGPNQFYTDSEGGYINLSYTYNSKCSFDSKTGDLTCSA